MPGEHDALGIEAQALGLPEEPRQPLRHVLRVAARVGLGRGPVPEHGHGQAFAAQRSHHEIFERQRLARAQPPEALCHEYDQRCLRFAPEGREVVERPPSLERDVALHPARRRRRHHRQGGGRHEQKRRQTTHHTERG